MQVFDCLCRYLVTCVLSPTTLVLKLKEILISTLLHHPFLFKGKTNASSRSSRKNFWRRCQGGSTSSLPSTYHKLSSLTFTLFSIRLSFSSPPLLKRFLKTFPFSSLVFRSPFSFAFLSYLVCLLVRLV